MKDCITNKKEILGSNSQEIKNSPIIKEFLKKENDSELKKYPEDLLKAVALDLIDFWDLDKPSQNTLMRKIVVRLLKLENKK